ncbi:NAD(P)-binding protein [Lojkania enalia]|uniref:NAD(P)-binding protein n=1 Tax=Lojkania enalia TaxID=147567 RepID=A0A9P4N649_9PLEO|nr:NAD(P)-binding protein [Didymosphaeria enalia]
MEAYSLPATQGALVQTVYAGPLEVKNVSVPQPTPGSVVVKILAAPVLSYAKEVYDGTRKYPYPTPITPGSSRDDESCIFLMGLSEGFSPGSKKLMGENWRDGTWAQYCRAPLENVYVLNENKLLKELKYSIADLATLGRFLVVYGGLRDINLQAGETVVVAPATGAFGGGAVQVALAMGATVVAMGRDETKLSALARNFEKGRVKTVAITGDVKKDANKLQEVSNGAIDAVFDISPDMAAKSSHFKSCIYAIRHSGRISLMGGVREDVPIPYFEVMRKNLTLKGKWMYGRKEILTMIKLVEVGGLKIGEPAGVKTRADYEFTDWEKAFDIAKSTGGWDSAVIFRPTKI